MKNSKKYKQAHTDNTKYGMGDYYGTGIKAKIGIMREGTGFEELSPRKLKNPPRSVV